MAVILRGIELRYVLTRHLLLKGPMTVTTLVDELEDYGFAFCGRPSKAVSDALRWEVGRDRVRRLRRGLYGPGTMPRSTEAHIRNRVQQLHDAACGACGEDAF